MCVQCRQTFHCHLYFNNHARSKENLKELISEVYGRKTVQNFIFNTLIIGGKLTLSYRAGGAKVGSDLAQLILEFFGFPLTTYAGKAVGLLRSTYAGALGGSDIWGNDGVKWGALLGLVPWIYCEVQLESFARLFFDEEYLKKDLKEFVATK